MKTTVRTISVKYTQEGNTVTCDLVSEVQFKKVKNMKVLMQIEEVAKYIESLVDSKGRYVVHTRGKATCLETDEFNYETGRRIAHTKAQSKIFGIASNFFSEVDRKVTEDIMRCECNCISSMWQCFDHIDELSGIEHVCGLEEVEE